MKQPDMSHSPAYYQDQHQQIVTAYLSDPETTSAAPSAVHFPPGEPVLQQQQHHHRHDHHAAVEISPSELNSVHTSAESHPSDPWDSTFSQHNLHSQQQQPPAPADSVYPEFEQPVAVAPVTSGAVRKEERIRGSWTDHSSYMSGDNHAASVSRAPKRMSQDEEPLTDASQDALLMLFRMSIPIPIVSFFASLYTVFCVFFVLLISPLRLCSCFPYLRNTPFSAQLCDLLVPQLHIHERLIGLRKPSSRSPSTQTIYNDTDRSSVTNREEAYSVGGLLAVLLLSSFFSFGLLLLAWTAAFFWIFAMILGNPDGTERKDDGRAAVLGVTRWWQIWLSKARKSPS